MKYQEGDRLFFVCPFTFTIEYVTVCMGVIERNHIYYIDEQGAWLAEWDLFKRVEEAKGHAIKGLNKFYNEKIREIMKYSQIENEGGGY